MEKEITLYLNSLQNQFNRFLQKYKSKWMSDQIQKKVMQKILILITNLNRLKLRNRHLKLQRESDLL